MIIPPRRDQPLIGKGGSPNSRFAEYLERIADAVETSTTDIESLTETVTTLTSNTATYTVTNGTTDRTYDADTVTVAELADIVATLIVDLKAAGVIP